MAVTGLKKFNLVAVKSDFYDKGKPVEYTAELFDEFSDSGVRKDVTELKRAQW